MMRIGREWRPWLGWRTTPPTRPGAARALRSINPLPRPSRWGRAAFWSAPIGRIHAVPALIRRRRRARRGLRQPSRQFPRCHRVAKLVFLGTTETRCAAIDLGIEEYFWSHGPVVPSLVTLASDNHEGDPNHAHQIFATFLKSRLPATTSGGNAALPTPSELSE